MAETTVQTILNRRSIRRFQSTEIPEEDLKQIFECARQAPSGGNRQPWRYIVVKDKSIKKELAEACNGQTWMADAAVIVAAVGLPAESRWHIVDPAIGLQNLILAAHSLGYGTCWIGAFNEEKINQTLKMPKSAKIVCLTPVGVPAVSPQPTSRKKFSEVIYLDEFGNPYE